MLRVLRNKKTAKKIWIFLAIIIIPAFTLWGFGTAFRSRQEGDQIGRILGRNVSPLEFRDAVNAVRVQAVLQFGEKYTEAIKYINFENQAVDRLFLLYEARRRHLKANDKEVMELIESYSFFQSKGVFNSRVYTEVLQYVLHVQPRVFEEETRENIIIAKLFKQITKDVSVTDAQIREEYVKLNEKLSVDYLASLPSEFLKTIKYTEAELKDYFNNNSASFKQPPSFNLEYIALDSLDKVKESKTNFNKKGALEKFAKETGLTINETGLFAQNEPIPQLGWSVQGMNIISRLKVGECAPPIQSDKKFYILRLKEKKETFIPDFEKIKDKVKEVMLKGLADKQAKEKINQALNDLKNDNNFAKAAKATGVKFASTDLFQFGTYLEGIGASDSLWLAAEKLKPSEFSQIVNMPTGYYIVKQKSVSPVDEKKFNDEKTDFGLNILSQKKQEAFDKFLTDLKNKNR